MKAKHDVVLASRAERALAETVIGMIPDGYYEDFRALLFFAAGGESGFNEIGLKRTSKIAVVTAINRDLPGRGSFYQFDRFSGMGVERIARMCGRITIN